MATFQLTSAPPEDSAGVTALRRETKYALPHGDLGKLRAILEANCRAVAYAGPVSEVYSIYFDDVRLSGCDENIEGVGRRTKIRLRWYDQSFPDGGFLFEVKRRRGSLTSKDRFQLQSEAPLGSLRFTQIIRGLLGALPDAPGALLRARPRPVVLVAYRRRHYVTRCGAARITLDERVWCSDQCGRVRPGAGFARRLDGLVILEVKTPPGGEVDVARHLHPLRLRITRSSKYVQCCQALGAATGAHAACLL